MFDLFDTAAVPGLAMREDMLTKAQEAALIAQIDDTDLTPFRFQQWTGKRLTYSYGWNYDFEHVRFAPAEPMPRWLLDVRGRAAAFAGLAADDLVQALLIRYDPGAGIGWHKDRPVFEHVVGISLGSEAVLRLRQRTAAGFERAKVLLPPRSIYRLSGEVRHAWEHCIAPMEVPRWSITFRSLSDQGRLA
ncbi:alpha-ketoglutarate-dependent dioxygenase AlkB [Sphingobium sp. YR768]|uniref:alpha-ketoglutarate-dependent dioxygenase AlkB n=1 Tax=Sphingobium sp. YR768 TaxID=1884365 RepID=UPI0008D2C66F|nr:alpha-ketoglutarate-dependent dioxygenase AlkB [Sphingobium sp. YR768]SER54305.1 2OG-Fe(II) oxygenase superfamily protein [Sphingobium sp. YR768]